MQSFKTKWLPAISNANLLKFEHSKIGHDNAWRQWKTVPVPVYFHYFFYLIGSSFESTIWFRTSAKNFGAVSSWSKSRRFVRYLCFNKRWIRVWRRMAAKGRIFHELKMQNMTCHVIWRQPNSKRWRTKLKFLIRIETEPHDRALSLGSGMQPSSN